MSGLRVPISFSHFQVEIAMGIAIKVPRAVRIRRLHQTGLDAKDIAKLTGWPPAVVREALSVERPIKK